MRAVIQRVSGASVAIDGKTVASIGRGLLVLLGIARGDGDADIKYIVDKTCGLRIFEDEDDKLNLSAQSLGLELLIVSQFTLLGDARHGKRPSFTEAGSPADAVPIYERAIAAFRATGLPVQTGVFQAMMDVSLTNDGPVTILLDSKKLF